MSWSRRMARLLPVFALIALCASCSDFWVSENSIDHVAVAPSALLLKKGDTVSLTAQTVTVGGTTTDVTTTAKWATSPATSTVASVTTAGKVTILTAGSVAITAASGGQTGTANILAAAATLPATFEVRYNSGSTNIAHGTTFKVSAWGAVDSGASQDLSTYVSWTSGNTSYATVDTNGNVTVLSTATVGATFTINASSTTSSGGTITGSTTFTIT